VSLDTREQAAQDSLGLDCLLDGLAYREGAAGEKWSNDDDGDGNEDEYSCMSMTTRMTTTMTMAMTTAMLFVGMAMTMVAAMNMAMSVILPPKERLANRLGYHDEALAQPLELPCLNGKQHSVFIERWANRCVD
jgi:hypothetical protein